MRLTWNQYKTLKDALDRGVDEFTALGMIAAGEIPVIGPILIMAAGGLLKWGLGYIVDNLVPHDSQPTVESDPTWRERIERGEGVPLSPDVDPESWTKEGRMKWQKPENIRQWENLVNKVKNDQELQNKISPLPLKPVLQPLSSAENFNISHYLFPKVEFEVYDDNKKNYLYHPSSRFQGNSAYPGAVGGNYKRTYDKILTLNDLLRNKKI